MFGRTQLQTITIQVKTPKGYADKTCKDFAFKIIKNFMFMDLFRRIKVKERIINNNIIEWEIVAPLSKIYQINKRVAMYDTIIENIFSNLFKIMNNNMIKKANKKVKRAFNYLTFGKGNFDFSVSEKTKNEAYDLLKNHTKIKIIK